MVMDAQKLIVRRMVRDFPLKIAKKNWYKDKKRNAFKGYAERDTHLPDPNKRKVDRAFAREAERFLRSNPFAFLVGCQLDMGKKAWMAWRAPLRIAKDPDVGKANMKPATFEQMRVNRITKILSRNKLGSRNLSSSKAARNLKTLSKLIIDQYKGRAGRIWEGPKTFEELKENLANVPGFGIGLTNMTIIILLELGMVPQIPKTAKAKSKMQVKPDTHVCNVFYRTGLAESTREKAALVAAEKYRPEFPAELDIAGFRIGRYYCHKNQPACENCPLDSRPNGDKLCPRIGAP
jgi:endonuclease-3